MTFDELLKSIEGLTDEQVSAIKSGMKENKIHLSAEENIDERYSKLKTKHETTDASLKEAQALIAKLQPLADGNEAAQGQIAEYQRQVEEAEARAAKAERDAAIKVELLANGAVPDDVDYLMWRIDNGDAEVKMGEDGKLQGMDDSIKALKTAHPTHFKDGGKKKFEGVVYKRRLTLPHRAAMEALANDAPLPVGGDYASRQIAREIERSVRYEERKERRNASWKRRKG